MAGVRLTLQNRITSLMIISSVIFISVFTFIQLNNQLTNISRYNEYHANLSSLILKSNLEAIAKKAAEEVSDPAQRMQASLLTVKEARIIKGAEVIKEAVVFNKEGKIIASTLGSLIGKDVRYRDYERLAQLEKLGRENKWFVSDIDKLSRSLNLYLAIRNSPRDPVSYIAKITYSLGNIQEAFILVYKPVLISSVIIIGLYVVLGYVLSRGVIGPIKILNEVTKIIAAGNLSIRTNIYTKDELQELGETFNYMTEELIKMKEKAENANPLTKLPGNIVILDEVEKRIRQNRKFTVIYCDLDNFKAFNDKYGIAKGDEAIKLTADIFKKAIKEKGNPDDFIGHEGGDDFVLLTNPENAWAIADEIIQEFNRDIQSLYTQEDLDAGGITAHARDGSVKRFPIMTISLAGVTNEHRPITSYAEVTNIAAELKKKAKSIGTSVFVIDKRHA